MPTHEIRQRVNRRLEELYRRHLPLHDDEVVSYYNSGIGYNNPEQIAQAGQKPFSISLATRTAGSFTLAITTDRLPCSPSPRYSSTAWP